MRHSIKQTDRHVEAVLAALDILDCFQEQPSLAVKELAAATGLTRNRVMRLAGTLEHRAYLIYDRTKAKYTLGPRMMILGKVFERHQTLVALARPILRELVQQTGESASLYVRDGLERVVLAREESTQSVRYSVSEGQRMHLHAGAGGKVLLAFGPPELLKQVLKKQSLTQLTESTLTDPRALAEELEKVRRLGLAVSLGERSPDAGAIAAPVFDDKGQLVAALGIAGPASRIARQVGSQGEKTVGQAAQKLSAHMGYNIKEKKED